MGCGGGSGSPSPPVDPPPPVVSPPSTPSASSVSDVLTYHDNNARTGENLSETVLTLSNVNFSTFGKLFVMPVDGKVDAQPLYVFQMTFPDGSRHNVLYVATEHDSVYAFDADTGTKIWQVSVLKPGETPSDPRGCGQVVPEIGITATPVIDRNTGPDGSLYLIAMSKDGGGNYYQRLHALDLVSGAEQFGGPQEVHAHYPGSGDGTNGQEVVFDPKQYKERAGLLLLNGIVYTTWASHCDIRPYTGWIIGYDQKTLAQVRVLNVTPNGSGGSFWNSGAAPAADDSGNIYLLQANGSFGTDLDRSGFPQNGNFGNAFLKLSDANGKLFISDYFTMHDTAPQSATDEDLGSGGVLILPGVKDEQGNVCQLAVGAGKDRRIYVVDRDNIGKFNPVDDSNVHQELVGALPGPEFGMPAYRDGLLYYGAVDGPLMAFRLSGTLFSRTPESETHNSFPYPGTTPSISGNGSGNTIVWAVENGVSAVLHAYDGNSLAKELYNSNQASSGRDHFGSGNKFIVPTVANGKVYVGTVDGVAAFGLLPAK